jgi:hypothetical protein
MEDLSGAIEANDGLLCSKQVHPGAMWLTLQAAHRSMETHSGAVDAAHGFMDPWRLTLEMWMLPTDT